MLARDRQRKLEPTAPRRQLELTLPPAPVVTAKKGGAVHAIRLGSRVLTYRFQRGQRRTIGLYVDRHGLGARAPRWVPLDQIEAFIREKEAWILEKLAEAPSREPAQRIEWCDGGQLKVFGHDLTIAIDAGVAVTVADGAVLRTPPCASAEALRKQLLLWLTTSALDCFRDRVAAFAPKLEVATPRIALSTARTQWGSCTVTRTGEARIRLHWRLVHLSPTLIDYVVAHELAHIREMNHSPRFWRWVERLVPDYRDLRRELRRVAQQLPEI